MKLITLIILALNINLLYAQSDKLDKYFYMLNGNTMKELIFNIKNPDMIKDKKISKIIQYIHKFNETNKTNDKLTDTKYYYFDENGLMTKEERNDGTTISYEYDTKENLKSLTETLFQNTTNFNKNIEFHNIYDGNNSVIERSRIDKLNNSVLVKETFEYNSEGKLISIKPEKSSKLIFEYSNGLLLKIHYFNSTSGKITNSNLYEYDNYNNIIKVYNQFYDSKGKEEIKGIEIEAKHIYDKKESCIKESVYKGKFSIVKYKYDKSGLVSEEWINKDKIIYSYEFYNNNQISTSEENKALTLFNTAYENFENKNIEISIKMFLEYINRFPNGANISEAHFNFAFALLIRDGFFKPGEDYYGEHLGITVLSAIEDLTKSIRKNPYQGDAYWLRGLCELFFSNEYTDLHRDQKYLRSAIEDFNDAINFDVKYKELIGNKLYEAEQKFKEGEIIDEINK